MIGFNVAEAGHVVNLLPPIDVTNGATCSRFSMKNWDHASIIVQIGVSAAAFTKLFVKNCTAVTGGTATAIAFNVYKNEVGNSPLSTSDVLGARVAVAATGLTPSAVDNITYVIELDSAELTDGYPWVEVSLTNTTNSVLMSAVAILSAGRYSYVGSATVMA